MPYEEQIKILVNQGIQANTIHSALQRQHGFTGSYNAVQRFVKSIKDTAKPVTDVRLSTWGMCTGRFWCRSFIHPLLTNISDKKAALI